MNHHLSRREFILLAATATTAAPLAAPAAVLSGAAAVTAQDIIDRIRRSSGVTWKADTVDTIKAGDPAAAVTGIVTTSMATLDVLRRAVKTGANLVVTCGPTFYSRADTAAPAAARGPGAASRGAAAASDPVFAAKNAFIKANGLVVWRFSDHWRLRKPDPLAQGLARALGWPEQDAAGDPARVTASGVTLDALASNIRKKLNARGGIRVVGNPQLNVETMGLLPGSTSIHAALEALPKVDVLVAGEVREWESVEYARDQIAAGGKKGLVLLGRVLSEEPGMSLCADWLRTIVPELKTTWIPAGDPYWRPF